MLEIINSGLPYSLFPIDKAYEIGVALVVTLFIVGMVFLLLLYGHDPAEMVEKSIKHIFLYIVIMGLFSKDIISTHVTPIQWFVEGVDGFTMQIALYIGGDPIIFAQQIFNNYSKMVMDSKAFADALNPRQVGWWDYLGVKITEPILAFTIAIIHVVELIILSIYAGAAAFVAIIRKILLDIELVIGFLVIPFLLIPIMRHWAKTWLFLVIETAAVIIPVALIIGAVGKGIQTMFFNLSLDNTVTFILFLALLAAGIYLVLHAATFTHNLLHGSVASLSSMIANAKAAAAGRGVTMPITHTERNLPAVKSGAGYAYSRAVATGGGTVKMAQGGYQAGKNLAFNVAASRAISQGAKQTIYNRRESATIGVGNSNKSMLPTEFKKAPVIIKPKIDKAV